MNIDSWLVDTVYIASPSGVTKDGYLSYGTPAAVNCRLEKTTNFFIDAEKNEIRTDNIIVTTTELTMETRIWESSSFSDINDSKQIQKIQSAKIKNGGYTIYEGWF